ncbi:hypothetical protein ABK040_002494 [Willaertia magna]
MSDEQWRDKTDSSNQSTREQFERSHSGAAGGSLHIAPEVSRDPKTGEMVLNPEFSTLNPNREEALERDSKKGVAYHENR